MTTIAMAMGFNVRVGMEDNVLYRRGEPLRENAQLVERAVRIATELDRPIATPAQARELLALRGAPGGGDVMKPPPFAYAAPASDREAVELLAADGAQVLAGGQSLVPRMNAHVDRPSALVDVNRIAELAALECNGDVIAGAIVRADRLARDPSVAARLPVLADAAARVGHPAVRNRGTVGGNLAFADPANNLPVVARLAGRVAAPCARLRASARSTPPTSSGARTRRRSRTASCSAACASPGFPSGAGSAYYEVSPRSRGWGLAGAAAAVWLDADGRIAGARIALGGVGETAVRVRADALIGAAPGREAFAAAGAAARARSPRRAPTCTRPPSIGATWPASWSNGRCERRTHGSEGGRDGRGGQGDPAHRQRPQARTPRSSRGGCSRTACARTSGSRARTSVASRACAGPARCSSTASSVRSCLMFAVQADGQRGARPSRACPTATGWATLQTAFWENHSLQCGFCTPGMLITATELLERNPQPDEQEIRSALSGNLCRCTGYQHIVDAIQGAANGR